MNNIPTTLFTLLLILFTVLVQAKDVLPQVFVDTALNDCTKYASNKEFYGQSLYQNITTVKPLNTSVKITTKSNNNLQCLAKYRCRHYF